MLVGHSNGGLVARSAAVTSTSGIAGIVTVATPHAGAPISDNSQAAISYVHSTAATVVGAALNSIIGPLHAYLITQAVDAIFGNSLEQWLTNEFGTSTPGALDVTGFFVIVSAWRAYYCRRAYKGLVNVDKTWHYFTGGSSLPFDGFVPNSRTVYAGTTISDQGTNKPVPNTNHNDIIYRTEGITAITAQMLRIGMLQQF